jgi:hypothetical protein
MIQATKLEKTNLKAKLIFSMSSLPKMFLVTHIRSLDVCGLYYKHITIVIHAASVVSK